MLSVLLWIFFIIGLYGVQWEQTGVFALIVTITFTIGNMVLFGGEYMKLILEPETVATVQSSGEGVALVAGLLALALAIFNYVGMGIVILQAGVFSRWFGIYFILHCPVSIPAGFLGVNFLLELTFATQSITFIWMGWIIWSAESVHTPYEHNQLEGKTSPA